MSLPMLDPVSAGDVLAHHHHWLDLSSQLLANTDAAADAAAAAATDNGGWWNAYLQVFKNTLSWVHSTIDPPLRSIGWEQTWGPSIFIFTASMLLTVS